MVVLIQWAIFSLIFTVFFICIRLIPTMSLAMLAYSGDATGWLYSIIGLIFGIFAAFTIQSQAKKWDELSSAIRQEINSLRRLFWLSYHLPTIQAKKLREHIRTYLDLIVHEGWENIDTGHSSPNLELAARSLQEEAFLLLENNSIYSSTAVDLVHNVFKSREERMFQSAKRTATLLKSTIYVGAFMIFSLSFFIAVKNIWIDYIFVWSVTFLVTLIVMVIEDLEHPYRPGHWHITQDAYQALIKEVKSLS